MKLQLFWRCFTDNGDLIALGYYDGDEMFLKSSIHCEIFLSDYFMSLMHFRLFHYIQLDFMKFM